ncbi:MAG: hypothetical protein KAS32_27845, partial [Candidatus Peribacteraceae bacterium]|nr:hypothetical protein [Candidatus Peribacteraceae bacterium]
QASRHMDRQCHRRFYCWEGIKYYDGKYGNLLIDDILSISLLRLDEDADDVYEATMAVTDYLLYPANQFPKERLELSNASAYGGFASSVPRGVEITGVHGYGDGESATPYYATGQVVRDNPLAIGATTITTLSTASLGAGMTLRIVDAVAANEEQVYITSITDGTTFAVVRGVNGTVAAAHIQDTPLSLYEVPRPVIQATLVIAMRAWKRKDSAFQDAVGSPDTGLVVVYKDEDPFVKGVIHDYFRYL